MKCERIRPHLKAYLDHELGWWSKRRVEAHLLVCQACQQELGELTRLSELLRTAWVPSPSPHLKSRIMERVWAEGRLLTQPKAWSKRPLYAGATLLVVAGIALYLSYSRLWTPFSPSAGTERAGIGTPDALPKEGRFRKAPQRMQAQSSPSAGTTGERLQMGKRVEFSYPSSTTQRVSSKPSQVSGDEPAPSPHDSLTLQVADIGLALSRTLDRVHQGGGYLVEAHYTQGETAESPAELVIRIPSHRWQALRTQFEKLGLPIQQGKAFLPSPSASEEGEPAAGKKEFLSFPPSALSEEKRQGAVPAPLPVPSHAKGATGAPEGQVFKAPRAIALDQEKSRGEPKEELLTIRIRLERQKGQRSVGAGGSVSPSDAQAPHP